jgi:PAS domain S-box-containing protein
MVQTSMDGFWVTDLESDFLQVNEAYSKPLGCTYKGMFNMIIHDVEALENANETIQHIQKLKLRKHDHFRTQHKRKDGAIVNLEANVSYVEQEQEKLVVFLRDITERHQTLNSMSWSQQQPELEAQTLFQQ